MKRLSLSAETIMLLFSVAFGLLILIPYIGCLADAEWALRFMGVGR